MITAKLTERNNFSDQRNSINDEQCPKRWRLHSNTENIFHQTSTLSRACDKLSESYIWIVLLEPGCFLQSVYMYLLVSARSVNSGSTEKLQLKIKEKFLLFKFINWAGFMSELPAAVWGLILSHFPLLLYSMGETLQASFTLFKFGSRIWTFTVRHPLLGC